MHDVLIPCENETSINAKTTYAWYYGSKQTLRILYNAQTK